MTILHGSNCGYFYLTCHMSQSALWECEEACRIVAVCVVGEAWRRSVRPTPHRLIWAPRSFMFAFLLHKKWAKTLRAKNRERVREKDWRGEIRDNKRERKRCNLKLGISVTQIGVRFQESNNITASKNIYSHSVYNDFLQGLLVQTVFHTDRREVHTCTPWTPSVFNDNTENFKFAYVMHIYTFSVFLAAK